ncbi:MAG: sugar ABC transporter permease, partial [Actinobacteria bacterium]|nr:sugar ABC transporter permease [Actinomycetota bacterium]
MTALLLVSELPKMPRWLVIIAFLGPTVLLILFGLVYPAISTILGSFKSGNQQEWVGIENYTAVFTN